MKTKLLAAIYAAFIVLIIVQADSGNWRALFNLIESVPGSDKAGHFILMGTLALLANLALGNARWQFVGRKWLAGSVIVLALVTLEECSQVWFSYRHCDATDWLADLAGIVVMGGLSRWRG